MGAPPSTYGGDDMVWCGVRKRAVTCGLSVEHAAGGTLMKSPSDAIETFSRHNRKRFFPRPHACVALGGELGYYRPSLRSTYRPRGVVKDGPVQF